LPGQSFRGFAEKVAVVTNGGRGIGRAVALQLALQGSYVVVSYAQESEENKRALRSLQEIGTLANAVEADVSIIGDVKKLFNAVEEMYGRLDLLVNCFDVADENSFGEMDESTFQKVIDASLKSASFSIQSALSLMKNRPSPAIVNVVDAKGVSSKGNPLFTAVNAGIIGLTKALPRELKEKKIRVNCVAVDYSLNKPKGEESDKMLAISSPFDDTARAVVYLLSSEAKAVNGQIIEACA